MGKYQVHLHPRLSAQLTRHAEFIARVSRPAAQQFRMEFAKILKQLAENPYQFPHYDDPNLPAELYRKALFAKWYKAVFYVEDGDVYVDAVVDGRTDYNKEFR